MASYSVGDRVAVRMDFAFIDDTETSDHYEDWRDCFGTVVACHDAEACGPTVVVKYDIDRYGRWDGRTAFPADYPRLRKSEPEE